jgi:hypothetical protein
MSTITSLVVGAGVLLCVLLVVGGVIGLVAIAVETDLTVSFFANSFSINI